MNLNWKHNGHRRPCVCVALSHEIRTPVNTLNYLSPKSRQQQIHRIISHYYTAALIHTPGPATSPPSSQTHIHHRVKPGAGMKSTEWKCKRRPAISQWWTIIVISHRWFDGFIVGFVTGHENSCSLWFMESCWGLIDTTRTERSLSGCGKCSREKFTVTNC